jgi:hypothetical protein
MRCKFDAKSLRFHKIRHTSEQLEQGKSVLPTQKIAQTGFRILGPTFQECIVRNTAPVLRLKWPDQELIALPAE